MLPGVESLRVQSLWLVKKALPSREEPDISLSIMNSKARLHPTCYACIIRAVTKFTQFGTVSCYVTL